MATITFRPVGTKDIKHIYVRLSIDRNSNFKKNTGFSIHSKFWNEKTKSIITPKDETLRAEINELKEHLESLKTQINKHYNNALTNRTPITLGWLGNTIDSIHGKNTNSLDRLVNYFDFYIKNIPTTNN